MSTLPSTALPPVVASLSLATLSLVLFTACTSKAAARGAGEPVSDSRVITTEEMGRLGASTAWEALQEVAALSLRETPSGSPRSMQRRGRSSFHLDDTPLLIVDGMRVSDLSVLRTLDVSVIDQIEILNGVQGTLRYGTGSGGGAIVVTTRSR